MWFELQIIGVPELINAVYVSILMQVNANFAISKRQKYLIKLFVILIYKYTKKKETFENVYLKSVHVD